MSAFSSVDLDGFRVRAAEAGDVEAVAALMGAQNTRDYGAPGISKEDLRRRWEGLDLSQDTWLALTAGGELAGYAELRPDPPESYDVALYLADGPRQMELGAALLELAGRRATPSLPIYSHISAANPLGVQIFSSAGYRSQLSFLIMERILDTPPEAAQWASGISVRPFVRGQDEQAVYLVDEEAALDKGYHAPLSFDGWSRRMSLNSPRFDPGLWFLACQAEAIAGEALNLYHPETQTAWVDHLSVLRAWRKQGLGQALLLHSFGEFFRRGIRRVRLSVDSQSLTNAPRLYARVGMETVQEYHVFKKG